MKRRRTSLRLPQQPPHASQVGPGQGVVRPALQQLLPTLLCPSGTGLRFRIVAGVSEEQRHERLRCGQGIGILRLIGHPPRRLLQFVACLGEGVAALEEPASGVVVSFGGGQGLPALTMRA